MVQAYRGTPDDPSVDDQWYHKILGTFEAWAAIPDGVLKPVSTPQHFRCSK